MTNDKKKKVSISISEYIWSEASKKIPNKSKFIEDILESYLFGDISEEQELLNEIEEEKSKLESLQTRLCALRESKKNNQELIKSFDAPMVSIERIHNKVGAIGENQILEFARIHDVNSSQLLTFVKKKGFKIVKFLEYNQNLQ